MPLVLEGSSDQGDGHFLWIGGGVDEDEVLTSGLSHKAGVGVVVVQVFCDGSPDGVEGLCGTGEVDASQVGTLEENAAQGGTGAGDKVDNPVGETGFLEKFHQVVPGEQGCRGRLPDDGVSHEGRRGCEVAGNGGEVEGGDGEDEPFQGPVLDPVPGSVGGEGLLGVDLLEEGGVVTEEVGDFAGRIDLRLEGVLALVEHGGGVENVSVLMGDQIRGFEAESGSLFPGKAFPKDFGLHGRLYGHLHLFLTCLMAMGQLVSMLVRADDIKGLSCSYLFATDDKRDVQGLVVLTIEFFLEACPLWRTGSVLKNRFVVGSGNFEQGVGHSFEPPFHTGTSQAGGL